MRLLSYLRHTPLTGLIFVLLLAAIFGQIWFASTPLPLGGPNVWLAGAAVLLAAGCVLWRVVRIEERSAIIPTLVADFRPVIPVIAVSALLVVWALAVYLFTGTLDATRLGQMVLGIGVLFAVYLAVTGVTRAQLMALAIIFATFVSALFGAAIVLIGEPFITIWLSIAEVRDKNLEVILTYGRIAGLAVGISTFNYQLAAGIPMALAALLCNPFRRGIASRTAYSLALFVMLMTMVTLLVDSSGRAAVLGVLVGSVSVALLSLRLPRSWLRLVIIVPLMAFWLIAIFNPTYNVADIPDSIRDLFRGPGFNVFAGIDEPAVGHTLEEVPPSQRFTAQVRAADGAAAAIRASVVTLEVDGSTTLVWPEPDGHTIGSAYHFRLKPDDVAQWGPWQDFCTTGQCFYLSNRSPIIYDLFVGDVTGYTLNHAITGLEPGGRYQTRLRTRSEYGYSSPSPAGGRADDDGSLTLTWVPPDDPAYNLLNDPGDDPYDYLAVAWADVDGYQLRFRRIGQAEWSEWRDFTPTVIAVTGIFDELSDGTGALAGDGGHAVIGHTFGGLPRSEEYVVQLRTLNSLVTRDYQNRLAGLRAIAARSESDGSLTLTWREPDDPASITGNQFRIRKKDGTKWLRWLGFEPDLSSRGPALAAAPPESSGANAGNSPGIRQRTIDDVPDLIPNMEHPTQLRAQNEYGYGPEIEIAGMTTRNGSLMLAWREPDNPSGITGYQFRVWDHAKDVWRQWQDFDTLTSRNRQRRIIAARIALHFSESRLAWNSRIFNISGESAQSRIHLANTALRYSLDYPLGTGVYAPTAAHVSEGVDPILLDLLYAYDPHNHFLYILTAYGFPGLILLLLFYALVLWSLIYSGRYILRTRDWNLYFLGLAVVGALAAYTIATLFASTGPFRVDWSHFFVIGLVFSLQRIVAARQTPGEPAGAPVDG